MPTALSKNDNPAPALPKESCPELYPRRVLLCMAGLTPATITETLYALSVPPQVDPAGAEAPAESSEPTLPGQALNWVGLMRGKPLASLPGRPARRRRPPRPFAAFVPTEIHLITTLDGQQAMMGPSAQPDDVALPEAIRQLVVEYPQHFEGHSIEFGKDNVHVIKHPDGKPVTDFATEADSEATGNAILDVLRDLVADENCAIHASYAGGRKSMGAMLVLAMSLLGRRQDRLSQVLIPSQFEGKHFLFPPAKPVTMHIRKREVNTADAKVTLATLPLLRVFDGLGVKLRDRNLTFEGVIELGELALEKRAIIVKPRQQVVQIGHMVCKLTASEVGLYTLLAERRLAGLVAEEDKEQRAGAVRWQVDADDAPAIGFDPEDPTYRKAAGWFATVGFDTSPMPDGRMQLRPRVSTINRKLVAAFAPELAQQALIVGPRKGTKGDGMYGLFNADALTVSA